MKSGEAQAACLTFDSPALVSCYSDHKLYQMRFDIIENGYKKMFMNAQNFAKFYYYTQYSYIAMVWFMTKTLKISSNGYIMHIACSCIV